MLSATVAPFISVGVPDLPQSDVLWGTELCPEMKAGGSLEPTASEPVNLIRRCIDQLIPAVTMKRAMARDHTQTNVE